MRSEFILGRFTALLLLVSASLPFRSYAQQTVVGDVNGDGRVSISDITYVVEILNDRLPYNSAADLNHDGVIDENDLEQFDEVALAPIESHSAVAIINGQEVQVEWVQLSPDGPKWAVFNVGATAIGQKGDTYDWNYQPTWGANWRKPTIDELLTLCDVERSTGTYPDTNVSGVYFTNEDGEQIFMPMPKITGTEYWSSTEESALWHEVLTGVFGATLKFTYDSKGKLVVKNDLDFKKSKNYLRLVLNE